MSIIIEPTHIYEYNIKLKKNIIPQSNMVYHKNIKIEDGTTIHKYDFNFVSTTQENTKNEFKLPTQITDKDFYVHSSGIQGQLIGIINFSNDEVGTNKIGKYYNSTTGEYENISLTNKIQVKNEVYAIFKIKQQKTDKFNNVNIKCEANSFNFTTTGTINNKRWETSQVNSLDIDLIYNIINLSNFDYLYNDFNNTYFRYLSSNKYQTFYYNVIEENEISTYFITKILSSSAVYNYIGNKIGSIDKTITQWDDGYDTNREYIYDIQYLTYKYYIGEETEKSYQTTLDFVYGGKSYSLEDNELVSYNVALDCVNNINKKFKSGRDSIEMTIFIDRYFYDENDNLVYSKESGQLIKVNDIVRPYILKNSRRVPLGLKEDGTPKDYIITSSEFNFDGEKILNISLIEKTI